MGINGWTEDWVGEDITGAFGAMGDNENGRTVHICGEMGLCVDNTYLKNKDIHKYTKVTKDRAMYQGGKEANGRFGRKINQDLNGNKKLF